MRNIMRRIGTRKGFTLLELVVCLVVAAGIALLLLPAIGGTRRHRGARQIKDSTQVRGVHQGLVMFAQNNKDQYPMPSLLDMDDHTVAAEPASKDTTANIMSILIYNGYFGPELCVTSAETNPAIRQMVTYAYSDPASAANPSKALWDPAFAADFTSPKGGNFSYAHMMPAGERLLHDWSNTFSSTTAVLGNRGPAVTGVTYAKGGVGSVMFDTKSNTLLIHGSRTTWEGNIVTNDNAVSFQTRMDPEVFMYTDGAGAKWGDCLFFDEPQDASLRNAYLSIWTKSGATPGKFASIWD